MKKKGVVFAHLLFLLLPFCSLPPNERTVGVHLAFFPSAYEGGDFPSFPTETENTLPCAPEGISSLALKLYGSSLSKEITYNLTPLLSRGCEGELFLPAEEKPFFIVVEGYSSTELKRKGYFEGSISPQENPQITIPLFPAKRTPGGEGWISFVDILKLPDRYRVTVSFLKEVYPATRGGESALFGALLLYENNLLSGSIRLDDPEEEGLPWIRNDRTIIRTPFRFTPYGELHIDLPYHNLLTRTGSLSGKIVRENGISGKVEEVIPPQGTFLFP